MRRGEGAPLASAPSGVGPQSSGAVARPTVRCRCPSSSDVGLKGVASPSACRVSLPREKANEALGRSVNRAMEGQGITRRST